jgi:hypothetical protein
VLRSRILANVALSLAALLVSLLVGEALVRLLYKDRTTLFPRYHTDYRYGRYAIRGIRPNSDYWMTSIDGSWRMITNSRGFRNTREFTNPKPAGVYRVLVLGDSHTQGYEVRQDFTYSAVLERYLGRSGKRAEVINAGVSGFSTAEELVFLENEGVRYTPDAVVLGFSANDFEDNLKAGLFGLDGQNRLTEMKYEHLPGVRVQNLIYAIAIVRWLSENSYFYSLLFNNVWFYFKSRLGESATGVKAAAGFVPAAGSDEIEYAGPASVKVTEQQMALARALVERMHRFCRENGIRLVVVDIPRFAGRYRFDPAMPSPLPEKLVQSGVELVDSRTLFGAYAGVAELHVPRGAQHISEFAHALIGLETGRRLSASGAVGTLR